MSRVGQDLKYAVRSLVRSRFVTLLALLAFALGIGVTTAVFSILNGVLLKPLPFPQSERLVVIYGTQPACSTCPASFPKYLSSAMTAVLHDVRPTDGWVFAGTALSLLVVATAASYLPADRLRRWIRSWCCGIRRRVSSS